MLVLSLSSCLLERVEKTIERIGKQTVTVQTPMVENARCTLTDQKGYDWFLPRTPGSVLVTNGHGPLVVVCKKPGYKKSLDYVSEERVILDYLDMLEEGVAVAIDPSGSISKRYPEEIVVWLEPKEWESGEQMRAWALEKRIYDNKQAAIRKAKEDDRKRIERQELELSTQKEFEYRKRMQQLEGNIVIEQPRESAYQNKVPKSEKFIKKDIYGVRPPDRKRRY